MGMVMAAKKKTTGDSELFIPKGGDLRALQQVIEALRNLDKKTQVRVIASALMFCGLSPLANLMSANADRVDPPRV